MSGFLDFPVRVVDFGTPKAKAGKGVVKVLAKRPKDKDRFGFVCHPAPPEGVAPRCAVPDGGYSGRWRLDGAAEPGSCKEPTFPDELIITAREGGGYETKVFYYLTAYGRPDADGLDLYGWAGAGTCATGAFDLNVSVFIDGPPGDCPLDVAISYGHTPLFGECPRCNARWIGTMTRVGDTAITGRWPP